MLAYTCLYTFIFNVLDMPTASLPVTLVQPGEDLFEDEHFGADVVSKAAHKTCQGSQGCPVGIQISCLPYEDEKLCGISKQFEAALKFNYLPVDVPNKYKENRNSK